MDFPDRLDHAQSRWQAVRLLLARWQDRPKDFPLVRRDFDGAFFEHVDEVRRYFDAVADNPDITEGDRQQIGAWTDNGNDFTMVDAVAHGIDAAASRSFPQAWRQEAGVDVVRLEAGVAYTVADAPWPAALNGVARGPRASSLGAYGDDELPHVRVHRTGGTEVEFDFTAWRTLERIGRDLDVVATLHPNADISELGYAHPRPVAFPLGPVDADRQLDIVMDLVERALAAGARILVLPELAATADTIDAVAQRLASEDSLLAICGSRHVMIGERRANVSVGLLAGRKATLHHEKLVAMTNPLPSDAADRFEEGLDLAKAPVLRVWVGGPFRFAILICRDFIDQGVHDAALRAGVNVALVPAMSEVVEPVFTGRAGDLAGGGQAVSVVANGPVSFGEIVPHPQALVARPYQRDSLLAAPGGSGVGVVITSIRDARVEAIL